MRVAGRCYPLDALERWIFELGDDDSDLREQLHRARRKLGTEP